MWADKMSSDLREIIAQGRRVVIHPDVMELATDLVSQGEDKVRKVAPFAIWPDYDTWVEGEIPAEQGILRFGFYFTGSHPTTGHPYHESVSRGAGFLCVATRGPDDYEVITLDYDLAAYKLEYKPITGAVGEALSRMPAHLRLGEEFTTALAKARQEEDPLAMSVKTAELRKVMKPILIAILALMNSPKLVRVTEHTQERFNARRLKRGKYPYFPFHQVDLNIDKTSLTVQRGQGDGPERALHFVRAHPRFYVHPRYKQASVVIVQPHWRGNPELGIKDPSYNVGREGSVWPDRIAGT